MSSISRGLERGALIALGFWRGMERLIAALTGAIPRADDQAWALATFARSR